MDAVKVSGWLTWGEKRPSPHEDIGTPRADRAARTEAGTPGDGHWASRRAATRRTKDRARRRESRGPRGRGSEAQRVEGVSSFGAGKSPTGFRTLRGAETPARGPHRLTRLSSDEEECHHDG